MSQRLNRSIVRALVFEQVARRLAYLSGRGCDRELFDPRLSPDAVVSLLIAIDDAEDGIVRYVPDAWVGRALRMGQRKFFGRECRIMQRRGWIQCIGRARITRLRLLPLGVRKATEILGPAPGAAAGFTIGV